MMKFARDLQAGDVLISGRFGLTIVLEITERSDFSHLAMRFKIMDDTGSIQNWFTFAEREYALL